MDNRSYGSRHLTFLLAAIVILVMLDRFILGGTRPYIEEARQDVAVEKTEEAQVEEPAVQAAQEPEQNVKPMNLAKVPPEIKIPEEKLYDLEAQALPQWQQNAVAVPASVKDMPKVIIVIDDMGVSRGYSQQVLGLEGPLTLAFLPYARGVAPLAAEGRKQGHELMVHMPMEPMNGDLDMGGIALKSGQTPQEFDQMLEQGLGAFSGYVGINNHMGSRLTQDEPAMKRVMAELKARGLLFLDSRTIGTSVAAEEAAAAMVPYAVRDVFLDDDVSLENVRMQLQKTEEIALEHGQAIAIGHPKPNTITALREWLPTLEEKGIALVPISNVVITTPLPSSPQETALPAPSAAPEQQHP